MQYVDMDDIRHANRRAGHHWFEPDTMRFFRSRVGSTAYGSDDGRQAWFVSSEQDAGPGLDDGRWRVLPRRYTVRRVALDNAGPIETVGTFQQYASWSGADRAAQRMARQA
jgi:hypothetical protein